MTLSAHWAAKFGRPDLTGVPADPWGGTSNVLQTGASVTSAFGTAEGRLTAGFLGLLALGLVGFYVWTRSHQA